MTEPKTMPADSLTLPRFCGLSTFMRVPARDSANAGPLATDIPPQGVELDKIVIEVERRYIQSALELSGGVRKQAAKLLGISFRSLRYRLDKLDID